jgi:hypothetical protein
MSGARRRALLFIMIALAVTMIALVAVRRTIVPGRPAQRPTLLLLTSLPLVFSEGFALTGGGSPALKKLQSRYRVLPISVTDGAELAKGDLLLMAQPPTQTAENLVVLDQWVRRGGHLLLLADPMLEWPSKLPLGNPTRPPPMFVDTGLLGHWGLRLDAPDERGAAKRSLAGYEVMTVSPGALYGTCHISIDRFVARCRVGRGEVTVIADADILDVDQFGRDGGHNLDAILAELAQLRDS